MHWYLDIRLVLRLLFAQQLLSFSVEACLGGAPLGFYPAQPYAYGAPYGPYSAASRTRMASPSHTFTSSNSVDQLQPVSDCVLRYSNQKLGCVQPFERRAPSTEHECQQICDEYTTKCRGYQFDSMLNQCELFDVDQYGRPRPEQFAAADDAMYPKDENMDTSYRHKRFTKNPFDEFLRDPLKMMSPDTVYCEPAITPAIGTTYVQSDYNCKLAATHPPPPVPSYVAKNAQNTPAKMPLGRASQQPIVRVDVPDCPESSPARIQLIDGIEVVQAKPIVTVQLDSPDACLHICRLNTHLDGTKFPKSCKASAFDRSNGRCYIFDGAISPNGDLNYMPNPNSIYFEKMCIPASELPVGCDDIIHRIPQHTLDRRASGTGAIVTASTQINCIRQCISAVRQLGFECMSASYFFDWPSENCYLSRFTRISRPDIYVAERKQFVDYLEMAKCGHNTWQHDQAPSSWSEWSKCDESMTKTRQRNCTGCKQRKEQIPCISEVAFQNEFPKSLVETELEAKKIATNFESARRYKEASKVRIKSEEASLFGEQDYENQQEISFFGPPLKETIDQKPDDQKPDDQREVELEGPKPPSLITVRSSIRPIRTDPMPPGQIPDKDLPDDGSQLEPPFQAPDPSDFASAEIFVRNHFNLGPEEPERHHKQVTSKRDKFPKTENDENALLRKALQEAEQQHDSPQKSTESVSKEVQTTTVASNCNPKIKCCPRPGTNEKSARLKGCVIGFRLAGDGRQIACTTDEYCAAQASTAAENLSVSYSFNCWLFAFVVFLNL